MRVRRAHIENYRSALDVTVELGEQTAILGSNGSGKSSIIRAIDRFYGTSTKVSEDDFHNRNSTEPFRITLTFDTFSNEEREVFGSRIHNDEMSVCRVFSLSSGDSGRYYGMTRQHPDLAEVRAIAGARDRRTAYMALRDREEFADLPPAANAGQVEDGMNAWEQAHPDLLEVQQDDGQFLGFANVARGSLSKYTMAVFIPAMRDAAADATDSKGSVVARLMELVVRSVVQNREDLREFQERVAAEFAALTRPENLAELGVLATTLTDTLRLFYSDTAVKLLWQEAGPLQLSLPAADVHLDDGFSGPVDGKGHGLQRAFILTLLQHLAAAVASSAQAAADAEDAADVEPAVAAAPPPARSPDMLLLIEEPELYQHPTKQRHFMKVLTQLSAGSVPGVTASTQVMFASHSNLFVSMERFDEIRIARKKQIEVGKCCDIVHSSMIKLARRLERAWLAEEGSFSEQSLRPRLHVVKSDVAEGLFADAVVMVEGISDRAALMAVAQLDGIDLEARGIAVVAADGKTKLDKPAAVFQEFGIPLYMIWDCDRNAAGNIDNVDCNKALQRLFGTSEADLFEAATHVGEKFACFENKLEVTLRAEIGEATLAAAVENARVRYGFPEKQDVMKNPTPMYEALLEAAAKGETSPTLTDIVARIVAMVAPTAGPRPALPPDGLEVMAAE